MEIRKLKLEIPFLNTEMSLFKFLRWEWKFEDLSWKYQLLSISSKIKMENHISSVGKSKKKVRNSNVKFETQHLNFILEF